ncbi:nucleotidyl transferase AbiEii/AbiGii toxin family protein [Nocardia puris]|uniref:nucleotidyl transferase AbiEii/AbiGii toxin family protein n=1 Tax=Nocardia puris TaxID=208602 RepID=UPI001896295A|nr:nucleotidyl transferase AbiEii/AbiGii toxin family protein [Nocardia puris]MBF6216159.1 nucleotidyl transferase AbiEii/AbiGii toxin family protein [Nocardia puris]
MSAPNPSSFKASLRSRIQTEARHTRRPASALRREFFMQRFLARIFAEANTPWIVTGGGGLLVRMPGVRSSQDLDLVNISAEVGDAINELRNLGGARPEIDPFVFRIDLAKELSGDAAAGAQLKVSIYLGATMIEAFELDLAVDKVIIGDIESLTPTPILELDGFAALPPVRLIPVPSQLADKVCAFLARYGATRQPSNRWRDLADLCFIVDRLVVDAALTRTALDIQQRRRGIELPTALHSPGPEWPRSYPAMAKQTSLPVELHDFDNALAFVGTCLNPLLDGTRTHGLWDPESHSWPPA